MSFVEKFRTSAAPTYEEFREKVGPAVKSKFKDVYDEYAVRDASKAQTLSNIADPDAFIESVTQNLYLSLYFPEKLDQTLNETANEGDANV